MRQGESVDDGAAVPLQSNCEGEQFGSHCRRVDLLDPGVEVVATSGGDHHGERGDVSRGRAQAGVERNAWCGIVRVLSRRSAEDWSSLWSPAARAITQFSSAAENSIESLDQRRKTDLSAHFLNASFGHHLTQVLLVVLSDAGLRHIRDQNISVREPPFRELL